MLLFQTITTPKKAKYELRNRTILVPASAGGPGGEATAPPVLEFSGDEEMIADEMEPAEMREQAMEALTNEISNLQVETNSEIAFTHEISNL